MVFCLWGVIKEITLPHGAITFGFSSYQLSNSETKATEAACINAVFSTLSSITR